MGPVRHGGLCRALIRIGAALAALLLSFAGCGLPDSFYLSPPSIGVSTGALASALSGNFVIQHTDRSSEPDFRGYELYYKLYTGPPPVADQNLGTAATTSTSTVDALMTQSGFLTLCRGPSVSPPPATASAQAVAPDTSVATRTLPLILIDPSDRGSNFTITINVNPVNQSSGSDSATNFTYTAPTGVYLQEVDRHVNGVIPGVGVPRCMPFTFGQGYYQPSDLDISAIWSAIQGTLYIAVYAVSYGLQDLSTPIYSYPVYMGYLSISGTFVS
jgi:hypothetical protein